MSPRHITLFTIINSRGISTSYTATYLEIFIIRFIVPRNKGPEKRQDEKSHTKFQKRRRETVLKSEFIFWVKC